MATPEKQITIIPGVIKYTEGFESGYPGKRKVAAYARVSTGSEEQLTSYEAQKDYYEMKIKENPVWQYAGIYADEGISGTSTKGRVQFNKMVSDALSGKIDLIITKSVSRFARNTVDSLTTIRNLKEHGVEVFFEKENIYTLDAKGELLISLMSSLAQEESRSLSQNISWGKRKRFADGKVSLPYKHFLGYEKGENGHPKIVEEEAEIIRLIYKMFLAGNSAHTIAKHLTSEGIKTPAGCDVWQQTTVLSILRNEKYKGEAILQKTFTADYLTKKVKDNTGEVPKYYVQYSHPAIISPDVYDLVQLELERRKNSKGYITSKNALSGKLICGECGATYGSKLWHSNSKYKRTVWHCNQRHKKYCKTPPLNDWEIHAAFVDELNRLVENKDELTGRLESMLAGVLDSTQYNARLRRQKAQRDACLNELNSLIRRNATVALDLEAYEKEFTKLSDEFEETRATCERLSERIDNLERRRVQASAYLEKIRNLPGVIESFDENLWNGLLDRVIVNSKKDMRFIWKDGTGEE